MTKILPNTNLLGDYVRAHRESLGLSLAEVARRSGLDYKYWSKVETGDLRLPSPRHLTLIAATVDAQVEDLYGLVGYDFPERLPSFGPYLRTKYADLPPDAVADLERMFSMYRAYYDIPDDQPIFPPRPKPDQSAQVRRQPSLNARNRADHPWRTR
jgi:transcriptional regulator with XRE-family HTH domain